MNDPTPRGATPADMAWRGIEMCRHEQWQDGLDWLRRAFTASDRGRGLPALAYAYYGYGLARYRRRGREGLQLCKRAVRLEFYQPEGYYYLARTALLLGDRRGAAEAVDGGLDIDADNTSLLRLQHELGPRRPPVLRFLSRRNVLNRVLGGLRHAFTRPAKPSAGGKGARS